jgi:arabinofuranan 3-O-arabinosyltransferase
VAQGHGAEDARAEVTTFGPEQPERAAAGRVRAGEDLPRVTMRANPTGGMVRLIPRGRPAIVDGGAEGIAALAGFGALDTGAPLQYAADVDAATVRRAGHVVITDTNRRQAFVAARLKANRGHVLAPDQELSEDGAMLDPFAAGPDAQTVARLTGVRSLWSPFSPQTTQFPEHRPYAALDGDERTAWLGDRALDTGRHWMEVTFEQPAEAARHDRGAALQRLARRRRGARGQRAARARAAGLEPHRGR